MNTIEALVSDFTNKLTAAIQADVQSRLQAALSTLSGSLGSEKKRGRGRPPKAITTEVASVSKAAAPKAAKKPISAKRAATMARQGKYMAMLRQLSGGKLAKVRAVAKKDGVDAALALGNTFLK
jgi:hypothetical protein